MIITLMSHIQHRLQCPRPEKKEHTEVDLEVTDISPTTADQQAVADCGGSCCGCGGSRVD